VSYTAFIETET